MKPDADNRKRKRLPANIPPTAEQVGVCVVVPNDPEYIALLMGSIFELSKQSIYDRDDLNKAAQIAAVWSQIYDQTAESVRNGESCTPIPIPEEGCTDYLPSNSRFSYAPNDPFSSPNFRPPGYSIPPFYTNPLVPLPGVQPTDAMVNFLSLPVGMTLTELIEVGYPRISIPIVGTGEVEIELVRVPQGGIAIVLVDGDFSTAKVLDLNSVSIAGIPALEDILDVVLENSISETEIVEFQITTPGAHTIDVNFFPNFGSNVLLGFGGGLRRVSYCAGAQIGDTPVPEFRITDCNLEWRPNNIASWENLGNVCGADGADGTNGSNGAAGADAQLPVGAIIPFGGTVEPAGWIFCRGQVVSRTTYAELFSVIGVGFGAGDGSTTFRLPDLRQKSPRGIGTSPDAGVTNISMGQSFGDDEVVIQIQNIPSHQHSYAARENTTGTGTALSAAVPSATGTLTTRNTNAAGGAGGGGVDALFIMPRVLGTEFIICYQSVNNSLDVDFQVDNCLLQWRKNGGAWVDLVNISDCATPGMDGLTTELRAFAVNDTQTLVQWKYTTEPDLPAFWRNLAYIDDGAPGSPLDTEWRLRAASDTLRVLEWKLVSDPDDIYSWHVVGSWEITPTEECDCPDIPPAGEIMDADRCNVAWGLANRLTAEIAAYIDAMDLQHTSFPLSPLTEEGDTLFIIRELGIFLIRFPQLLAWHEDFLQTFADDADALAFRTDVLSLATRTELARFIYSFYDPNQVFTDTHAATIALALITAHIGDREYLAIASWLTAPNIEHWQDHLVIGAASDNGGDCTGFAPPNNALSAFFNFTEPSGEIFEDDGTYTAVVELSLPVGVQLGEETRVYYHAEQITAENGNHFFLPDGFITFPATAVNGTIRNISFSVFDNDTFNATRQLRIRLTQVVGNGLLGSDDTHLVDIKDNEDFYLILGGRGTDLERIDTWTWRATATQDANFWRLWLDSMNLDPNRCFKVLNVTFEGQAPDETFFLCGSGGTSGGRPTPNQEVHALRYATTAGVFSVIVEIEPA